MKYSVKIILWKHNPNPQGLLPIYLKVSIAGVPRYISTGHYLHTKYWDETNSQVKPGHKDAKTLNADIEHRRSTIIKLISDHHLKDQIITSDQVKEIVSSNRNLHNIFDFADEFSGEVKNKRAGATLENYRKHLLKLELFHGSRNLTFEEINTSYLARYENHLWQTVEGNYIHALFKTLRTIFNAAIKRGVITCYPFKTYENPVYKAPGKDHLSLTELHDWESNIKEITDPVLRETAIYFLFGCYSGLRISDWHNFKPAEHISGDRIKIRAKKNGEWVSMMISTPLARVIKLVKKHPLTIQEPTLNEKLKIIAKTLGIKKHLTSHVARNTFAITLCANRGISCETCAELMGITVATCLSSYYKVTGVKINAETARAWEGLT